LGYDTGTVEQKMQKVGNNTSAVVSLQIQEDKQFTAFFNSFLIWNVVAPDISLTKIVENAAGQDVEILPST
jgi:hypothetical protein